MPSIRCSASQLRLITSAITLLFILGCSRSQQPPLGRVSGTVRLDSEPLARGSGAASTYNRTSHDGWAAGGVATLFVTATDPGHSNPGGLNNLFFESPGSDHVGGCFFAMADGSVHWLSEFIDAKDNNAFFPLLGSIRDGAVASLAMAGY